MKDLNQAEIELIEWLAADLLHVALDHGEEQREDREFLTKYFRERTARAITDCIEWWGVAK